MIPKFLLRYFSRLKFPWLLAITALLFGADMLTVDPLPFADELLLGMLTLLFGAWRGKKVEENPPQDASEVSSDVEREDESAIGGNEPADEGE